MAAVQVGSLWVNPDHIVALGEITPSMKGVRFQVFMTSGMPAQTVTFATKELAEQARRGMINAMGE